MAVVQGLPANRPRRLLRHGCYRWAIGVGPPRRRYPSYRVPTASVGLAQVLATDWPGEAAVATLPVVAATPWVAEAKAEGHVEEAVTAAPHQPWPLPLPRWTAWTEGYEPRAVSLAHVACAVSHLPHWQHRCRRFHPCRREVAAACSVAAAWQAAVAWRQRVRTESWPLVKASGPPPHSTRPAEGVVAAQAAAVAAPLEGRVTTEQAWTAAAVVEGGWAAVSGLVVAPCWVAWSS